jgi:hypothetical protein
MEITRVTGRATPARTGRALAQRRPGGAARPGLRRVGRRSRSLGRERVGGGAAAAVRDEAQPRRVADALAE